MVFLIAASRTFHSRELATVTAFSLNLVLLNLLILFLSDICHTHKNLSPLRSWMFLSAFMDVLISLKAAYNRVKSHQKFYLDWILMELDDVFTSESIQRIIN